MKCSIIMSDKYPCFCRELALYGYNIIPTDKIDTLLVPEQKHADMQILRINNDYFILKECMHLKNKISACKPIVCSAPIGKRYPENIMLNFLYYNNALYGKLSAISTELKNYCKNKNIKIINVNQGYCRCSTLAVNSNSFITADGGIEKALINDGAKVLRISEENIRLEGFNYGFIGGAGGTINDSVFFFGNIESHPDYESIENFINKHNKKIKIICKEMPLTDIGGIVKLE